MDLRTSHPLLARVVQSIAKVRSKSIAAFRPSEAVIEVWFGIEIYPEFLRQLIDPANGGVWGVMSTNGEAYGAVCAGAECYCSASVVVEGEFTIRLRVE